MPVKLITERLVIQPNHVFIIPAQRDLHVLDGEFRLEPISKPRSPSEKCVAQLDRSGLGSNPG
jgi:chemotaxis response regulator CheB